MKNAPVFINVNEGLYVNPANIANMQQRHDGYVTVTYKEKSTDTDYKQSYFSVDKLKQLEKQGLNLIG